MDSKTEELVVAEKIPNRNGKGERLVVRASSGMFMKKPDPLSKEEIQKSILTKVSEVDDKGSSVLERVLDRTISNAMMDPEQPVYDKEGNQVGTSVDARIIMASAKSAQVVLKAAGLEQPEKKDKPTFDVKVVIITPPENMVNKEIIRDEDRFPPLKPTWIDAEFQETFSNTKPTPVPPVGRTGPATKEMADVEWLMQCNAAEITKRTSGVPMSSVLSKANSDLPVRTNKRNILLQGFFKVAAASIRNQASIEVLVEQD